MQRYGTETVSAGQKLKPASLLRHEILADVRIGVNRVGLGTANDFRSTPINGHRETGPVGPFRADCVAKRFAHPSAIMRRCATLIQESIRLDSIVAYFYSTASPR
jgi:hypothetical protein